MDCSNLVVSIKCFDQVIQSIYVESMSGPLRAAGMCGRCQAVSDGGNRKMSCNCYNEIQWWKEEKGVAIQLLCLEILKHNMNKNDDVDKIMTTFLNNKRKFDDTGYFDYEHIAKKNKTLVNSTTFVQGIWLLFARYFAQFSNGCVIHCHRLPSYPPLI